MEFKAEAENVAGFQVDSDVPSSNRGHEKSRRCMCQKVKLIVL